MSRRQYATFANVTHAALEAQGYVRAPYRDGVSNYAADVTALRNARANLSAIVLPAYPGAASTYDDALFDHPMLQVQGGGIQVAGARQMESAHRPRPTIPFDGTGVLGGFERTGNYDGRLPSIAGVSTWSTGQSGEAEYNACQALIAQVRSAGFTNFDAVLAGMTTLFPDERRRLCNLSFYIELDAGPEHVRWDTYEIPAFDFQTIDFNPGTNQLTVTWFGLTGGQNAYPNYRVSLALFNRFSGGVFNPAGTIDLPWSTGGQPLTYTQTFSPDPAAVGIRVDGNWFDPLHVWAGLPGGGASPDTIEWTL